MARAARPWVPAAARRSFDSPNRRDRRDHRRAADATTVDAARPVRCRETRISNSGESASGLRRMRSDSPNPHRAARPGRALRSEWRVGKTSTCGAGKAPETLRRHRSAFRTPATGRTGVSFTNSLKTSDLLAYLYPSGYACGGVALGDVNGDARPDLFLVSGPNDNAHFLNKGDFRFEASPSSPSLNMAFWGVRAAFANIDADNDLDLFVTNDESRIDCGSRTGTESYGVRREGRNDFAGPSQSPISPTSTATTTSIFPPDQSALRPFGRPAEPASELGPDGQPRVKKKYAPYFRVVDRTSRAERAEPRRELAGHSARIPGTPTVTGTPVPGPDDIPLFKDVTCGSGIEDVTGAGLSALIGRDSDSARHLRRRRFRPTMTASLDLGPGQRADSGLANARLTKILPYTTSSSMGSDVADVADRDGRIDFYMADMARTTHFKQKRRCS